MVSTQVVEADFLLPLPRDIDMIHVFKHQWPECQCFGGEGWVRGNAVKDFLRQNRGVSLVPYAEGVRFQSPGSAEPRSGGASPWVRVLHSSITPKALYKGFDGVLILVERLRRTRFVGDSTQGARPTTAAPRCPRPWALEYNRFAVKRSCVANHEEEILNGVG